MTKLLVNNLALVVQQGIERGEDIDRVRIAKPNHFVAALLPTGLIEAIEQRFDDFQVRSGTRSDDRVGSGVDRDAKLHQRTPFATGQRC